MMARRGWKSLTAETLIVNLADGTAIRGALLREHRSLIVLGNAELLAEAGQDISPPVKMDGETIIDTERIRYAQKT